MRSRGRAVASARVPHHIGPRGTDRARGPGAQYFFATTNAFYLDEPLRHIVTPAAKGAGSGGGAGHHRVDAAMRLLAECRFPSSRPQFYEWSRFRLVSMSPLSRAPWTLAPSGNATRRAADGEDHRDAGEGRDGDGEGEGPIEAFAAQMERYCRRSRVRAMKEIRFVSPPEGSEESSVEVRPAPAGPPGRPSYRPIVAPARGSRGRR